MSKRHDTNRYFNANGKSVPRYDDSRLIWYAPCGHWTDDFSILKYFKDVPVCPFCGCPGFQIEASVWFGKQLADREEEEPGYTERLKQNRVENVICRNIISSFNLN